jgi:leader peptidase (prepilin peptidase)/N-methyltransferase
VPVTVIDIDFRIIPNKLMIAGTVAALAILAITQPDEIPEHLIAAVAAGGFLFIAALAYPGGMGMGDVKLALLMGAALGKLVSVALMVGMFAALVPGLYLLARHGSAGRKIAIPFAPFLALGSIVALFAGNTLFHAYVRLLGA